MNTQDINFDNIKFRASSWGNLLTEPRTKSEGALGVTCQKELIKIYNMEMYGRRKEITTRAMDKGILLQTEGIQLYSIVEGELYQENSEPLENEWFKGTPDMFTGESIRKAKKVSDLKNSYELDTFMPKLIEGTDKAYEAQLNVYYDLCGCDGGDLVYTLLDAPAGVLMQEYQWLLKNGNYISEESPDFLIAWAEKERLLTFQDIDYRERVIKIPVPKNEELIQKMKQKVPFLRQWLAEFHKKHLSMYPKN